MSRSAAKSERAPYEALAVVRRTLPWAICLVVVVLSLAIAYAFLVSPIYRTTATVLPVTDGFEEASGGGMGGQLGGLAALVGVNINSGAASTVEALAVLKSRAFLISFLENNGAAADISRVIGAKRGWWLWGAGDQPTTNDIYAYFSEEVLDIREDRFNGIISITVDWHDRDRSANWANGLVKEVNDHLRHRARREAELSLTHLRNQLDETSVVELRQNIFGLIGTQQNRLMLAGVRDEFAFKFIDRAIPEDEDKYHFPNRPLIVAVGFLAGLLIAGFLIVGRVIIASRALAANS